jgi:probable HAF family extracellular repeat protein
MLFRTECVGTGGLLLCVATSLVTQTLFPAAARPIGPYYVTDLGAFTGTNPTSIAHAINSAGQVVGFSSSSGINRAFLWQPSQPNGTVGTLINLGDLPGGANDSTAFGINNVGQVVGRSADTVAERAFLWQPDSPNQSTGALIDLGDLPGGGNISTASGINSIGQTVGVGQASTGNRAFLWQPQSPNATTGTFIDLGDLTDGEDYSIAHALNDAGQIAGTSWMATGRHPFVRQPSTPDASSGTLFDLGSLPGGLEDGSEDAAAVAINTSGYMVEASLASTGYRAFLWQPTSPNGATGTMLDLGHLGTADDYSLARAINDAGQVVGLGSINIPRAFYWDANQSMVDLNSYLDPVSGAGWVLNDARGINNAGQIVGYGQHNGIRRAFLLSPAGVPEPDGSLVLSIFSGALVLRRSPLRHSRRRI